jgi:MoaA/NifB/PqqE/SkfB family radical SAM enzyme
MGDRQLAMTFVNSHGWPLEHWHIEPCSKCSLKCPRCSRQEVPEGLVNNDLSLEWFKENFTGRLLTDVRKLTFCGDDGDPVYAKDLLKILSWFRQNNAQVQFIIVTNGSYKTKEWWSKLDKILDEKDHIHFSLDGWDQESNNLYRVNCDWESIMLGVDTLKNTKAYKTWASIAFKFNEDRIPHMQGLAKQLNFDAFQLTLSTKFSKNYPSYPVDDPLQPSDQFIATGRFTRTTTKLSTKKWKDSCLDIFTEKFYSTDKADKSIIPLCMIGNKGLYINAKGKFKPCCWTGLRYQHNQGLFPYIDFDRNLSEVLDDPMWSKLFSNFGAVRECGEKCSSEKWSLEHATKW